MADVFISYSSNDRDRVRELASALKKYDLDVWWDPDIKPGQDYREVIQNALDDASCVIVIWSQESIKSKWVQAEAENAMEKNLLIPVLLEKVRIPMPFNSLQTSDLESWSGSISDEKFKELISGVELHCNNMSTHEEVTIKEAKLAAKNQIEEKRREKAELQAIKQTEEKERKEAELQVIKEEGKERERLKKDRKSLEYSYDPATKINSRNEGAFEKNDIAKVYNEEMIYTVNDIDSVASNTKGIVKFITEPLECYECFLTYSFILSLLAEFALSSSYAVYLTSHQIFFGIINIAFFLAYYISKNYEYTLFDMNEYNIPDHNMFYRYATIIAIISLLISIIFFSGIYSYSYGLMINNFWLRILYFSTSILITSIVISLPLYLVYITLQKKDYW